MPGCPFASSIDAEGDPVLILPSGIVSYLISCCTGAHVTLSADAAANPDNSRELGVVRRRLVVRSKLQQSLSSLRVMISQVRAAIDWLSRPVRMDNIVAAQCVLTGGNTSSAWP